MSTMAQSAVPSVSAPAPTRKRATSSMGFCVADRPMRTGRAPPCAMHSACSRSSDSARWLPRLLAAIAWISSTITLRTVDSIRRPDAEPSSTYSDSGVVTRMCGGRRRLCWRSRCGVSPVRTAVRMSTSGSPSAASSRGCPRAAPPGSGGCRWRAPSAARRRPPRFRRAAGRCEAPAHQVVQRGQKAVSVLPEPVGAATSVSRPARIAGHASAWAEVGPGKVRRNHWATAGWNECRATGSAGYGRDCGGAMREPLTPQVGTVRAISRHRPCRIRIRCWKTIRPRSSASAPRSPMNRADPVLAAIHHTQA
jgi:hypothetical protein